MKHFLLILTFVFFISFPSNIKADSVTVGDLEFNNLFPGVNDFTVNNFTGSNNLGVFPVADNVTFDNVVLTATESDGTILSFDLGDIAPGTNTSAQFADSLLFTQVVFSATLDPSTFTLADGSSFVADPTLSFTLLPSTGSYLVAGVDLGIINANATSVPEPSTISLFALGLFGMVGLCVRKHLVYNRV